MKKLILITLAAISIGSTYAQQSSLTTQHWTARNIYNPAAAGTMDFMHSSILVRNQWAGMDGGPSTGIFTFDMPFHKQHMGAGLTVIEDQIGVTSRLDVAANYHYHIEISDEWKLAFGLKAGVSVVNAAYTQHTAWDADDPMIQADQNAWLPNFGFGTYLWKDEFTYVGIGIPELMSYDPADALSVKKEDYPNLERHYFMHAGYAFDIDDNWAIQPNTMMRFVPGAPFQFDLGTMVVYQKFLAGGLSYRLGDAASAMIRMRIAQNIVLGYAYDYTISDIKNYSSGSHEAYLSYRFGEQEKEYRALFGQ